jgi:lipoate-protein ligase A
MYSQWHLIYDCPSFGAYNMAADDALLTAVAKGDSPPVLRLYAWSPPCLSLGYGQRASDADFERIAAFGWHIVRRPTGGRAILHTDELTYSVILPTDHPLVEGSVVESYRRISEGVQTALRILGVSPQAERAAHGGTNGAVCFETPSHYEITVNGRKLVGSAQLRRKEPGGVLQHGSIPLHGDIARICDALVYASELEREQAKTQVRARATTLADVLGESVSWQTAADALVNGFGQTFNIDFSETSLSPEQRAHAERLTADIYAAEAWTLKRA